MISRKLPIAILVFLNCLVLVPGHSAQGKQLLQGEVNKEGYIAPSGADLDLPSTPSLSRSDIQKIGDPFARSQRKDDKGISDQVLDAPQEAFKGASVITKANFNLNADQENNIPFIGQPGFAQPDTTAFLPQQGIPGLIKPESPNLTESQPQTQAIDPDSTPEMQLAWDEWHRRVASAIFERFNFFASRAFGNNPTLVARVAYVVTQGGEIQNVHLVQKSPNPMFNLLVLQCVNSINGNMDVLQFPSGSRRTSVDKGGIFDRVGNGFRYTVGDRETIPGTTQR